MELAHRFAVVDGVRLHYVEAGEGPLVVLLHGFPEFWWSWRHQIPALVQAGYRVVAPDQRGYAQSDKPRSWRDYRIERLAADVAGLIAALGEERAFVVGHDWGAAVAWILAATAPERVERLVAIAVGHPNAARQRTVEDREKAWYMLLFQFEGIAEELLARDDWAFLRAWLREDGDVERYVADLSRPGALTAGLNWYRANLHPARELEPRPPIPRVAVPTLGLWSSGDNYLNEAPMLRSAEQVTGPWRYERVEDASHWMQLDQPERVNALLLEFLTSGG
jgi:pimeloyl-ACP methyl ester carboxylesterase